MGGDLFNLAAGCLAGRSQAEQGADFIE